MSPVATVVNVSVADGARPGPDSTNRRAATPANAGFSWATPGAPPPEHHSATFNSTTVFVRDVDVDYGHDAPTSTVPRHGRRRIGPDCQHRHRALPPTPAPPLISVKIGRKA